MVDPTVVEAAFVKAAVVEAIILVEDVVEGATVVEAFVLLGVDAVVVKSAAVKATEVEAGVLEATVVEATVVGAPVVESAVVEATEVEVTAAVEEKDEGGFVEVGTDPIVQSTLKGQSQIPSPLLKYRLPPPISPEIGGHSKRQGTRFGPHSQNLLQSSITSYSIDIFIKLIILTHHIDVEGKMLGPSYLG